TQNYQGHRMTTVEASPHSVKRLIPAGTYLVRTAQPLGDLIVYLLEPQSEDGLTTWNFFDDGLAEGKDFPVLRLPHSVPITVCKVRPLPEDRTFNKPIAFDPEGHPPISFAGSPVTGLIWLDDGEHLLQTKAGRLYEVEAATGRAELFDKSGGSSRAGSAPTARARLPRARGRGSDLKMNPDRSGTLVTRD